MIKQMAVATRRPDMTHEEYVDYVKHIHGYQITVGNPVTIHKYVQSYVFDGAYGAKSDVFNNGYQITYGRDSVTELYFDSPKSMTETFSDPYVNEVVGPDGANFSDLGKTLPFLVEEQEIEVPYPTSGGIKIFYFINKNEMISNEEFSKLWLESHEEVLKNNSSIAKQLKRFVNNVKISAGETDYFSTKETITYDGIATMWFEDTGGFRAYQKELAEIAHEKNNFINQSNSFFLYTDALTIYEKN